MVRWLQSLWLLEAPKEEPSLIVNLLLPLGISLIVASLLMSVRKRHRRKACEVREAIDREPQPTLRTPTNGWRATVRSTEAADNEMVKVEAFARRYSALMDAKAARLDLLIRDAENCIRQLARSETGEATEASSAESACPTSASLQLRGSSPAFWAVPSPDDPAVRQIVELRQRGVSNEEIALALRMPVQRVELIVALHEDLSSSPASNV